MDSLVYLGVHLSFPTAPVSRKDYIKTLLQEKNPNGCISIPDRTREPLQVPVRPNHFVGFFRYMFDRQEIWFKRFILEQPAPWTDDPILGLWKFTNVWRELDRGTVYLLDYLNDATRENFRHCLSDFWNIMHYRLFNNAEAHKALGGFVPHEEFNYDDWYEQLRERWAAGKTVLCTAHNTCVYAGFPGQDKVERVCLIAKRVHEQAEQILDTVFAARSLEEVFKAINAIKGYGPFLSYEVVTDILYTGITPFKVNDWANAGPGAINGINHIFDLRKISRKQLSYVDIMQFLCEFQDTGFSHIQEVFGPQYDFGAIAWRGQKLDLRCVEHSLCEYSKILKLYAGTGRNFSGHFKGIDRGQADFIRMKAGLP